MPTPRATNQSDFEERFITLPQIATYIGVTRQGLGPQIGRTLPLPYARVGNADVWERTPTLLQILDVLRDRAEVQRKYCALLAAEV